MHETARAYVTVRTDISPQRDVYIRTGATLRHRPLANFNHRARTGNIANGRRVRILGRHINGTENRPAENMYYFVRTGWGGFYEYMYVLREMITESDTFEAHLYRINLAVNTPSNSRVDVVVRNNDIRITTGFTFNGTLVGQSLNGVAFTTLFSRGVSNFWSGNFTVFGHRVTLTTVVNNSRPANRRVTANMTDGSGRANAWVGPTTTQDRSIQMYRNFSDGRVRTSSDFRWTVAHEFGHTLGLLDVYTLDPTPNTVSIMNRRNTDVQNVDVEAVIRAYATGRPRVPS